MQQLRRILVIGLFLSAPLISPIVVTRPASAAPNPGSNAVVQEIKVTAVVAAHRDIVIDLRGKIIQITSNTTEDVTPTVYSMQIRDDSKRPLNDGLLQEYRKLVPPGTGTYGVLYSQKYENPKKTAVLSSITTKVRTADLPTVSAL